MNKTNKLRNNTAILLCIGGILLNLVLSTAVSVFGLLVYLDTVGTVAVAVKGGYLPGVIAGFTTNFITGNAGIEAGVVNTVCLSKMCISARKIRSFFSSTGIKSHGSCTPFTGCFQRIRASARTIRPVE